MSLTCAIAFPSATTATTPVTTPHAEVDGGGAEGGGGEGGSEGEMEGLLALSTARELLALPRTVVDSHPETGKEVTVGIGR